MADAFKIFVTKIPKCSECPFYIEDTNHEFIGKEKYRCMLKSKVVTGQFGGMDIAETDVSKCPFEILPCISGKKASVSKSSKSKCPQCGCPKCS